MEELFTGLSKLTKDIRDISHAKVAGTPKNLAFPNDFLVPKLFPIQNQLFYDFCASFAGTSVSEDQEKAKLSEAYQFAKAMQVNGELTNYGCDLRTICKSFIKYGSLEENDSPFKLGSQPRNFLADWRNWPFTLDNKAEVHKKGAFLRADLGGYDVFDNIRASIWQSGSAVLTGSMWYQEWWYPQDGIIPITQFKPTQGHAFVVRGWKTINGTVYLIAQLSNGNTVGDSGYLYFPREVINREVPNFGAFTFLDNDDVKSHWSFIQKLVNYIYKFINTPIMNQTPAEAILARAKELVGQDASPNNLVDNEVACAESVSTIIHSLYPNFPIITGTASLLSKLVGYSNGGNWQEIDTPQAGAIIISPTGFGTNPNMPHGHTGICGENGLIYSNSSSSIPAGKWEQNYTIDTWRKYFQEKGGYPVRFFIKIKV